MSLSLVRTFITATVTLLLVSKTRGIITQEDGQCIGENRFDTPFIPGDSCEDIYNKNVQSRDKSGYYWILNPDGPSRVFCGMAFTGSSCEDIYATNLTARDKSGYYRVINNEWVYCNMTLVASEFGRGDFILSCAGVDGAWRRVASFDIAAGDDCPSPWVKSSNSGVNFCIPATTSAGCYSVNYSTYGMSYQKVCGRASAYQKGSPDGFAGAGSIEGRYADGISITHGSPRQHIWTCVVGLTDSGSFTAYNCPCAVHGGPNPPTFVGSHYYCESGGGSNFDGATYHINDVLWDGAGCSAQNTCCSHPNLPWFYRQLSQNTQDDIEVRSCVDEDFSNEAILITSLELYIQ